MTSQKFQVRVSNNKVGSKTYYEIAVASEGKEWIVHKRFSALRALHRQLEGRLDLPAFPERRTVRRRQAALEEYLPRVLEHSSDPTVVAFFGVQPHLETGSVVRVCVDQPAHGWQGLIDRDSVGVVVTSDNDLVVVAFKGPGRWLGLASELELVDDDTNVVAAVLDAHRAFALDTDNVIPMSTAMPQALPRMPLTEYHQGESRPYDDAYDDDDEEEKEEDSSPRQAPERLTAADAFCARDSMGNLRDSLCAYFLPPSP